MFSKIPPILQNFYLLTGTAFLMWVVFFDEHDLISQIQETYKYSLLEDEKEFYAAKITEVHKEMKSLRSGRKQLESFAREKYLLKKDGEDVYVLVPSEE